MYGTEVFANGNIFSHIVQKQLVFNSLVAQQLEEFFITTANVHT